MITYTHNTFCELKVSITVIMNNSYIAKHWFGLTSGKFGYHWAADAGKGFINHAAAECDCMVDCCYTLYYQSKSLQYFILKLCKCGYSDCDNIGEIFSINLIRIKQLLHPNVCLNSSVTQLSSILTVRL